LVALDTAESRLKKCFDQFLGERMADRFSHPHVLRFTLKQVTHTRKPFLMFASTGMLLGNRFIAPVSWAIIISMQFGLKFPS
jgi:hypothetical protein